MTIAVFVYACARACVRACVRARVAWLLLPSQNISLQMMRPCITCPDRISNHGLWVCRCNREMRSYSQLAKDQGHGRWSGFCWWPSGYWQWKYHSHGPGVLYLGNVIIASGSVDSEVSRRLVKAAEVFWCLHEPVFPCERLSVATKKSIYVSVVFSTLVHGAET